MGNANAHERRRSGPAPDTGLAIEDIRPSGHTVPKPDTERRNTISGADKLGHPLNFLQDRVKHSSDPKSPLEEATEASEFSTSCVDGAPSNASKGLPTIFKYTGSGKEAYVCGTFSNWQKIPMVKSQKDFVALIDLPVGEHEYKFLVDNEWTHDTNSACVENEVGTKNNCIVIHKDDFDAFAALDMDSKSTRLKGKPLSNEIPFGQDVPGMNLFENKPGPPILPPHLLQVILNKDTPLSCEPTLLPEPNHVMINHLYALSIKDGVMVLSSTQRYRKKYVTTLLYKPIEGMA